jgi:hypothetical protein
MDVKRIPKRILESNIVGKRPVGKPRKGWVNSVEIDGIEISKMRKWKRESPDRKIWRGHRRRNRRRRRK